MNSRIERERLIEQQEARVLRYGSEVARWVDVRAIASRLSDEERHGRPGTVRNWSGALIACVTRAINEARARESRRKEQTAAELERYADLWVAILGEVAQRQPEPAELSGLLRTMRQSGFPHLNPRIAEKLSALGSRWPLSPLTRTKKPETKAGPRRHRRGRKSTCST
jgi:hypothetical protein